MKRRLHKYVPLLTYFLKADLKAVSRYIGVIFGGLMSPLICFIMMINIPRLFESLLLANQNPNDIYLEADTNLFFKNEVRLETANMYYKYINNGYEFQTTLFDYSIELPFTSFFNYTKIVDASLQNHQITLGGGVQLYYDLAQILEKTFMNYEQLNQYLHDLPLPMTLSLNHTRFVFLIQGFMFLEDEEIVVIKNQLDWGENIFLQAGCNVVFDGRLTQGSYIEKNTYIPLNQVENLDQRLLLFCNNQECLIQEASSPLFGEEILRSIKYGYIYIPLNPYVSGIIFQEGKFYLNRIKLNETSLDVEFRLDSSLTGQQEVTISSKLQDTLGLNLGDYLMLEGVKDNLIYRVSKIIPSNENILYQSSAWTYYDCKFLSGATDNEFLARQIYLPNSQEYKQIQSEFAPYEIVSYDQQIKQSLAPTIVYFNIGLAFLCIGAIVISIVMIIFLTLINQRRNQSKYNLLFSYGYHSKEVILLALGVNLVKTVLASALTGLVYNFLIPLINMILLNFTTLNFVFEPLRPLFVLLMIIFTNLIILIITFFSFVSLKDSPHDFC